MDNAQGRPPKNSRDHFRNSLRLLGTRRFGTFWFASLLSNIGTWAQQVAQPWLLLSLGASPFLIGLDGFASGAPVFLLTLMGGLLADRGDRRRIIAGFQSVQMLCPLLVVTLLLTGHIQPWMIILLSLVIGVTDALSLPSFQSIVPSLVRKSQIPTGIALNSTQFNLSRMLGPAIAGVLLGSIGAAGAYAVSAVSYIPFILVAWWILPKGTRKREEGAEEAGTLADLRAGVREILNEPALRGAVLTVLTTSLLCAPLITFCPVLLKEVFHVGGGQFGLTMSAFGLGGLLGAVGLLAVDPSKDRRPMGSWFALMYAAVVAAAAVTPSYAIFPALFVLAGAAMTASNASANALLQSATPERLRGRTVSLFMLAMRGGVSMGALLTGVTVGLLGVREALLLNGLLALLLQWRLGRTWRQAALPVLSP